MNTCLKDLHKRFIHVSYIVSTIHIYFYLQDSSQIQTSYFLIHSWIHFYLETHKIVGCSHEQSGKVKYLLEKAVKVRVLCQISRRDSPRIVVTKHQLLIIQDAIYLSKHNKYIQFYIISIVMPDIFILLRLKMSPWMPQKMRGKNLFLSWKPLLRGGKCVCGGGGCKNTCKCSWDLKYWFWHNWQKSSPNLDVI